MEEYQDFVNRVQKKGSKPYKIGHCLGSRDAWKWVRKNKWKALKGKKCEESLYSKIIDSVNQLLVEQLIDGHEVELPYQMGSLQLSSIPTKVYTENGKLKNNYRTDWKKTLEWWYEDPEARALHKPIKRIQNYLYAVTYISKKARYKNRRFYMFRQNRSLARAIGYAVEEGRIRGGKN